MNFWQLTRPWLPQLVGTALVLLVAPGHAQDAQWNISGSGRWLDSTNWTPGVIPTGTATFTTSNQRSINFSLGLGNFGSTAATIATIKFDPNAVAYNFSIGTTELGTASDTPQSLTITGTGISNEAVGQRFFVSRLGSVSFANASSAGTNVAIRSLGTLNFLNDSTAAGAAIGNSGQITFSGRSTAGSAQIINDLGDISTRGGRSSPVVGSVSFTNGSNAGSAQIINNGRFALFGIASPVTINARITFTDTSTAANATIVNNGMLAPSFVQPAISPAFGITTFDGAANAGNATITNNSGGLTEFRSTSSAANATITTTGTETLGAFVKFLDASTGGNARFITEAGGIFDMSGLSAAGMAAGSIEGAGSYVLGAKMLTVGSTNLSTEVSGVISGIGGALTKVGAGTLTLSGTNTYTGPTTVNAGTLSVSGSITASSQTIVNSGGTLGGTGTIGSTSVNAGGTLSPGNSIGVLTINGNLVLGPGAVYRVEISPASADRTNVSGTATLGGIVHAVFGPGAYTSKSYNILSANGGRNGTFDALTTEGLPTTLSAGLRYTPTGVLLVTLTSNIAGILSGNTPNQRAVAGAQDAAFNGGLLFIGALYDVPFAQLPGALDQLTGEVHASTASALLDESRYPRSAALDRLRQASYGANTQMASLSAGGPQAFAGGEELSALAYGKSPIVIKAPPMASQPGYDVVFWAQGFGARGSFNSDGNATSVKRDLAGFFSGVDTRVGTSGRVGIAAGYTGSRNNLDGRGSSSVETGHLMGYGGWSFGSLNLRAGGAYAWHSIETSRAIVFPGFFDNATANYNGRTGQIFGEAGYGFAFGSVAVEPFVGAAWVHLKTDAAIERGGAAALNIAANSFDVGYSTLGTRAASMIPLAHGMMLIPRASVAWQHAFNDVTPEVRLAFIAAPAPFAIAGAPIARDSLLGEAGLDLAIGRNATLGVSYVGQLARTVQDHAAKGKFSWKF